MEKNFTPNKPLVVYKIFFHVICVSSTFLWMACGSQPDFQNSQAKRISETRSLDKFHELEIHGNYEILLRKGDKESLVIEAEEEILKYLITEVQDHKLKIYNKEKISGISNVTITLTYTNLAGITSGGAGNIKSPTKISSESLIVKMKGAGLMNLAVDVDTLDVNLSGAGFISLSGKARIQNLSISGAGNLNAYELKSKACKVNLSGIGGAQIFVNDELHAQISGIGGIKYKGYPKRVKKEVAGLGRIKCEDEKKL